MLRRPGAVRPHTPLTTRDSLADQRPASLAALRFRARALHSARVHAVDSHRGEGTWSATRTTLSVTRTRASPRRAQGSAARAGLARRPARRGPTRPGPAASVEARVATPVRVAMQERRTRASRATRASTQA